MHCRRGPARRRPRCRRRWAGCRRRCWPVSWRPSDCALMRQVLRLWYRGWELWPNWTHRRPVRLVQQWDEAVHTPAILLLFSCPAVGLTFVVASDLRQNHVEHNLQTHSSLHACRCSRFRRHGRVSGGSGGPPCPGGRGGSCSRCFRCGWPQWASGSGRALRSCGAAPLRSPRGRDASRSGRGGASACRARAVQGALCTSEPATICAADTSCWHNSDYRLRAVHAMSRCGLIECSCCLLSVKSCCFHWTRCRCHTMWCSDPPNFSVTGFCPRKTASPAG